MLKIGSHVSMNGEAMFLGSVEEAMSYNATALMIYTGAPQNTRRKPLEALNIEAGKARLKDAGIDLDAVIVHAPYVMNLANPDPLKREFAIEFLVSEIERTHAIGASQIVLHPGAHVKQGPEIGIKNIIEGLNEVIKRTATLPTLIALETMAGKGTEIGRRFEEIAAIIKGVTHDQRLSVCFDTCHTHDAGYDINSDFEKVIQHFDDIVGKERISVFHINDSKNPQGAGKDRHENIGIGNIGFEALNKIVHHPDFLTIPKILETPYVTESDEQKDKIHPPYKEEIEMFKNKQFNPNFIQEIRQK